MRSKKQEIGIGRIALGSWFVVIGIPFAFLSAPVIRTETRIYARVALCNLNRCLLQSNNSSCKLLINRRSNQTWAYLPCHLSNLPLSPVLFYLFLSCPMCPRRFPLVCKHCLFIDDVIHDRATSKYQAGRGLDGSLSEWFYGWKLCRNKIRCHRARSAPSCSPFSGWGKIFGG